MLNKHLGNVEAGKRGKHKPELKFLEVPKKLKEMKMKKILLLLIVGMTVISCQPKDEANLSDNETHTDKVCALTFDDGPDSRLTPLVLEKLKKHNVVATFFVVGQKIDESTQSVLKEIVEGGNEIGNHSWSYDGMQDMSAEEVLVSVDKTTKAIKKYAGVKPQFFRAPNLSTSSVMFENIDYPFASGVLGFDWAGENTSAQERADNVLSGMKDGAIILLHDVQPTPHPTPEALDILIPELQKQGYKFVTLSELFKIKGVKPKAHEEKMWVYVE